MPIAGFPVLTAAQLPGFGREHFRWMKRFAHLAGLLVLLHDRSAGTRRARRLAGAAAASATRSTTTTASSSPRDSSTAPRCCSPAARARCWCPTARDRCCCGPATTSRAIVRRGVAQAGPNAIPIASTHPQSTCRMGGDPRTSWSDEYGECHEVRGLFVADMSVFPTSLGAPPQITTAALADRTAHHIAERWAEFSKG